MGKSYKNSPGKWEKKKKLKPFTKEGSSGKYKRGEHYSSSGSKMGNTKREHKLEVANANRSLKKGMRQNLKRMLDKELDSL